MPFDSVLVVRALAGSPAVAAANPILATLSRADTLASNRIDEVQLAQSVSAPHRLTVGDELPQLVDQVFTNLEGTTFSDVILTGETLAGTV
jgi:hypothetical protein